MGSVSTPRIAVLIKQTPDMNAARVDRGSGKVVLSNQLVMSSYDEYAVEEALRLKEALGGETVVITAGPAGAREILTRALAMGIDRGVHLETTATGAVDSLAVARVLAGALRSVEPTIVIAGQTADDAETGQVGAQVAELLDWPLISNVVGVEVAGDTVTARRDMEDGYQTISAALPVVLLSSSGLHEPRLPSLKGIMAAKKKPVDKSSVDLDGDSPVSWSEPTAPERTVSGILVQDVSAADAAKRLVEWLVEQKAV